MTSFKDRREAGQKLSQKLKVYKAESPIILALPRGGVVVGYEVAKALKAPLSVLVVRKIGSPHNSEFAIGAIAEDNIQVMNESVLNLIEASDEEVKQIIDQEKAELKRRVKLYRGGKPLSLRDKTVILVDDGLATGMTAQAAIKSVQKLKPKKVIFAVPVCSYQIVEKLREDVDGLVCYSKEQDLTAIGLYYQDFRQVSDEEVIKILKKNDDFVQIT